MFTKTIQRQRMFVEFVDANSKASKFDDDIELISNESR